LLTPEQAAAHPALPAARAMRSNRILGAPASVLAQLDALIADTGADEIMVSSTAHNIEMRMRSLSLLAAAYQQALTRE
jgi:alkanesulfonate monooxygenase SsuD/methylene tetrahydromethanopterin reductase-like flavin-dependent oxidoreductase (luciferase family)